MPFSDKYEENLYVEMSRKKHLDQRTKFVTGSISILMKMTIVLQFKCNTDLFQAKYMKDHDFVVRFLLHSNNWHV